MAKVDPTIKTGKIGRVWMRKKDAQLREAWNGCLGWVWFWEEPGNGPWNANTPGVFIDDPRDKNSPPFSDFEDLGELL